MEIKHQQYAIPETQVTSMIYIVRYKKIMLVFSSIREMLLDILNKKLDMEEITRRITI